MCDGTLSLLRMTSGGGSPGILTWGIPSVTALPCPGTAGDLGPPPKQTHPHRVYLFARGRPQGASPGTCVCGGDWEVWGTFVLISPAVIRQIDQRRPLQSKGISDVPPKAVLGVLSTLLFQIQGEHGQLLPWATSEGVFLCEPSSPVLIATFAFWYHLQPRLQVWFLCSLHCVPLKWVPPGARLTGRLAHAQVPGAGSSLMGLPFPD